MRGDLVNTQSPQILFPYNTLAWTRVFILGKNEMVSEGYLGIIHTNPLKYTRSKQTSGNFPGSGIPSNPLKYIRSILGIIPSNTLNKDLRR